MMIFPLVIAPACASQHAPSVHKAAAPSQQDRNEEQQKAEDRLKELEKELDDLKPKARRTGSEAQAELNRAVEQIQGRVRNYGKILKRGTAQTVKDWNSSEKTWISTSTA